MSRRSARVVVASWIAAAALSSSPALSQPPQLLFFPVALERASRDVPDLPAVEITLHAEANPPYYEVVFLAEDGARAVQLDAHTGEVLEREQATVQPSRGRYSPELRRALRQSHADLAHAITLAYRNARGQGLSLRRVAFQLVSGQVVIEVLMRGRGRTTGWILEPGTGRVLVGPTEERGGSFQAKGGLANSRGGPR